MELIRTVMRRHSGALTLTNTHADTASQKDKHEVHRTVNCELFRFLSPFVFVSVLHHYYITAFKEYFEITVHLIERCDLERFGNTAVLYLYENT